MIRLSFRPVWFGILAWLIASHAGAHEIRPALLQITQQDAHHYEVLWKQPVNGEVAVHLRPRLSGGALDNEPGIVSVTPSFALKIWKSVSDEHAVADDTDSAASTDLVTTNYQAPRTLRTPMAPTTAEGKFSSDGLFSTESKGAFGRPDLKMYTPTSEGSHGTVILSSKKIMHLDAGTHLLLVVQPPPSGDSTDGAAATSTPTDLEPQQ